MGTRKSNESIQLKREDKRGRALERETLQRLLGWHLNAVEGTQEGLISSIILVCKGHLLRHCFLYSLILHEDFACSSGCKIYENSFKSHGASPYMQSK